MLAAFTTTAGAQVSVKLGVLNDRSGQFVDLAGDGSVIAAEMAVDDFKAASKGIKVEVVSGDHQNKADVGAAVVRKWFDQDNVDVVLDVPVSSVALAVNQIAREKNKIQINSGAGAAELTGTQCTPNTIQFTYDTYALANGTATALAKAGGDSWFFITADYAFGHSLERDVTAFVEKAGGRVVGGVKHPLATADFSSYLLTAQNSKAKVVALANGGGDTINAIKQAAEFGIAQGGQNLAGMLIFISDVHALGLKAAQGLVLTSPFYWDLNDGTRAFARRFAERRGGRMPTMIHAGVYAGVLHYLKAVEALKGKDTAAVLAWMKSNPTDDPLFGKGHIRPNGRKIHDMYLFRVKRPEESKGSWDYYERLATIPAEQAFRPVGETGCALERRPAATARTQP
ncbi:ABC transporter substrate-binding protein [Chelatococcus reniformis]|uniref:ABC transporter substrate-binding protein n=1 Tax=Chelatococcus reniformis TaxID=1494448 RepID=A0A916U014_9HYPH|nr:ABC transporter substrate-binding protein [Chelatococcus reniformis]